MNITIGVALVVAIVGAAVYLFCAKPSKASFGELARIAYFVGLFYALSMIASHVWRLS